MRFHFVTDKVTWSACDQPIEKVYSLESNIGSKQSDVGGVGFANHRFGGFGCNSNGMGCGNVGYGGIDFDNPGFSGIGNAGFAHPNFGSISNIGFNGFVNDHPSLEF